MSDVEYDCFLQLKKSVEVEPGCMKRRKALEKDIDEFLFIHSQRISDIRRDLMVRFNLAKDFRVLNDKNAMKLFLIRSDYKFINQSGMSGHYTDIGSRAAKEPKLLGSYEILEDLTNEMKRHLAKVYIMEKQDEIAQYNDSYEKG